MKRAILALSALIAIPAVFAQQPGPQSTDPRDNTAPPSQASPQDVPRADDQTTSDADRQTLMKNCMRQVQSENPNVPEKDVRSYCEKAVKSYTAPQ